MRGCCTLRGSTQHTVPVAAADNGLLHDASSTMPCDAPRHVAGTSQFGCISSIYVTDVDFDGGVSAGLLSSFKQTVRPLPRQVRPLAAHTFFLGWRLPEGRVRRISVLSACHLAMRLQSHGLILQALSMCARVFPSSVRWKRLTLPVRSALCLLLQCTRKIATAAEATLNTKLCEDDAALVVAPINTALHGLQDYPAL